ncbi:MAG: hypothetical protein ABR924_04815 [Terracidiphilus sp.]|jgi:hypothetical protein
MELLDRYLEAVRKHLPWERQDDIIAELKANLEAQLEDKEAELGRPLTAGEAEDWLKQIGQPMQVAARYKPQQYLIGPAIFPTYWFVLRLAAFWVTVAYSIGVAVQIAVRTPSWTAVLEGVLRVPEVLLTTAASVTLIFAVIEFLATRYPGRWALPVAPSADWTPSALPPVEKSAAPGQKPRSYAHAVAEVVFGFVFLLWLLLVPHYPYLLLGPGAAYMQGSPFQLAPVLVQFYWWVVGLNVLQLGWRAVDLLRRSWQGPRLAQRNTVQALGLIPLLLLLTVRDHAWVTLRHPALDQARYGGAMEGINKAIYLGASIVCALAVLQLLWEVGRMGLNVYRKHAAAAR